MIIDANHRAVVIAITRRADQTVVNAGHDSVVFVIDEEMLRNNKALLDSVAYAIAAQPTARTKVEEIERGY